MATTFKVLHSSRLRSADKAREGKFDRFVLYQADDGRTGSVLLPDESFTEPALVERVKKDLADARALIGKTFQT